MLQKELTENVVIKEVMGAETEVLSLALNTKNMAKDAMFFALKGEKFNGNDFIAEAVSLGAVAICTDRKPKEILENVCYIIVDDANAACAQIAANFYGNPSTKLKLVAVTGTNGKTTIAHLLWQLFQKLGYKTGLMSTVGDKIGEDNVVSGRTTPTTPDSIVINELLARMVEAGCTHAFMEFSSHAAHLKRTEGIHFTGGIFTNLTQDHLDYHKSMEEYAKAKQLFFNALHPYTFALSNLDDSHGEMMLAETKAAKHFYSLTNSDTEFTGTILKNDFEGIKFDINGQEVQTKLIGMFNAYNLLAIYATAALLDEDKKKILEHLGELVSVDGRFMHIVGANDIVGIVDYAHSPDSMEKILKTIVNLKSESKKLITVFGCGGDRDPLKRPIMGHIAGEYSDVVIITSDNPRTEDPQAIIEAIKAGIDTYDLETKKYFSILDRHEAILKARALADEGDVIALLGKGHETYQIIGTTKHHFDDLEELKGVLE